MNGVPYLTRSNLLLQLCFRSRVYHVPASHIVQAGHYSPGSHHRAIILQHLQQT